MTDPIAFLGVVFLVSVGIVGVIAFARAFGRGLRGEPQEGDEPPG